MTCVVFAIGVLLVSILVAVAAGIAAFVITVNGWPS